MKFINIIVIVIYIILNVVAILDIEYHVGKMLKLTLAEECLVGQVRIFVFFIDLTCKLTGVADEVGSVWKYWRVTIHVAVHSVLNRWEGTVVKS